MSGNESYWQRVGAARSRRRVLRAGALGVSGLGAAWLAACGGDSAGEEETEAGAGSGSAVQPTQSGTVVASEGTPKPGGTYTWSDIGDTPLDPTANTTYRAQTMAGYVYSRLLKFNTGPTPETAFNYEVKPDTAASYELPGDGLQLTFKLNPNAKFHDKPPINGRAVTSEDVKASFERFRTLPQNTNRNAFGSEQNQIVTSMETPDPQTVVVKLAKPYAPILNLFANSQYLWLYPKEIGTGYDPAKQMIGNGPYMLDQVQPDVQITLKKNPNYMVQGTPYIDTVVRAVIPQVAQNIAQFQAGRLDIYAVPAANKAEVQRTNPTANIVTAIPTTYTFIAPQLRGNTPFKDVRVRQAISKAIDRKGWLSLLYEGQGEHYLTALPASMGKWWVNPQKPDAGPGGANYNYDAKAARDLLKAAGQENLAMRFMFANDAYGDRFNQGAETTGGFLKDAGFNPSIVPISYLREYIVSGGIFFGNYEGAFYGLQTPFTDPHDYLFNMMHPNSARNHAGVNDPKLTAMIDDEERTLNEAERVKKVHEIQRYCMEQLFYIPVAVGYEFSFRQPWMKRLNYTGSYGAGSESVFQAWIDRT